jgi:hypothetical protein
MKTDAKILTLYTIIKLVSIQEYKGGSKYIN